MHASRTAVLAAAGLALLLIPGCGDDSSESPSADTTEAAEAAVEPGPPAPDSDDIDTGFAGGVRDLNGTGERDDDGPLPGAVVRVTTHDGDAVGEAVTDVEGRFGIPVDAGGSYIVRVDVSDLPGDLTVRTEEYDLQIRDGQVKLVLFAVDPP